MEWLEIACHGAGHWLRALQSSTPPAAGHSLDEMLEYVDVRLERISQLGPRGLDAGWRSEVRGVFRDVRASEADLRVARIHGDFSLSNIIFDGRRTVAIDLTRFGVGSIYHDVSRLYHQLGLLLHKPYVRPATVARLRRALLSGYGGPADVAGQPLFQLFLIQHLLTHWLGLLKMSAAPYHVRAFHRWVGYRHKRELDGLVARLRQGAPRTGVRTWLNTTT
jgi:Ser/Thr protein kinase RdoA (MazF antagonist)